MATYTKYKSLEKPLSTEKYNVAVANKNNDVIDSELHKLELKNQSQDELLATNESLDSEISRATLAEETINTSLQEHVSDESNPHNVSKSQVGLGNVDNTSDIDKPVSTAQQNALDSAVSNHNISESSHNDMRILITGLTTRLNVLADSDDTTLDQLSEIVAYIKNNKSLIDGITTSKVNVSDIIDDLTSNFGDKPLSSKQGKILKEMIISLTKEDVGLGNVENKSSATIREELTKENITNALGYTPPTSNTTYGVVSTSANGLCPKRTGTNTKFLRDDGTWAIPTGGADITYSDSQPTALTTGMTWIGN